MSEQEPDEETELVCEQGAGTLCVFGRQLKRFRVRAGIERPDFGAATGYSASTIASFEQGRRIPPPRFIDKADELLDAGGVLQEMKEEVEKAQFPAFFRGAVKLEAEAAELHAYDTHVINGLLQTEEYARAVLSMRRPALDEPVIEQLVSARVARQRVFSRRPAPLVSFVIEEAVLRRPIGGEPVWRGELEHILVIGHNRNVEVQVMPMKRQQHAGLAGPFTLIETPQGRRFAYVEVHKTSHLYTELKSVRELTAKYGIIRAQALTPSESMAFIERLLVDP
ncbi:MULTISPECIES: helix-turn-helix domain-containing protein [Streptomyces]|uniref:XRE family transcriptional regulator n=2 Tax=Streptomyces TaxID=1883 RepID=A0A3R7IN72_9ACTN|nr:MULTISPECIES: helix-turn-helix transcriptional regulator [Streptomyces]KNE81712.1 DNA-binding protein [Streptomyces fradiae]OFA50026.1 transcriptional regulator [Streptomyces fradiae]PQM23983.1 XRE family transcriptional regulator [Streptomyces xinghaiensis]RKM92338.1 XRE family transcriptional regulator [Streptomyces xinghaiensis]RNC70309.1 XRE family transcriptional regulator [Streptomyces xinghaiensis]